jgi:hypothetical protein
MDTSAVSEPAPTEAATGEADADASARTHDVFFTTSKRNRFFYNAYRGVTLASDHVAWTFNNKDDSAWYKSIVEVRLQTGGSWVKPISICEITFADGYRLLVNNGNALGTPTDVQRTAYRDFVYDLHARLRAHAATRERQPIAFKSGFTPARYRSVLTGAGALGLMLVGIPLAALLFTGEVKPFFLLCAGLFFVWPLAITVQRNAPLTYDPSKPPNALIG